MTINSIDPTENKLLVRETIISPYIIDRNGKKEINYFALYAVLMSVIIVPKSNKQSIQLNGETVDSYEVDYKEIKHVNFVSAPFDFTHRDALMCLLKDFREKVKTADLTGRLVSVSVPAHTLKID